MNRIAAPRGARIYARPATERQVAYINALLVQVWGPDNAPEAWLALDEAGRLSDFREASNVIDSLKATLAERAKAPAAPADAPTRPALSQGMYRKGGTVYRVVKARAGHLYAKALDPATGRFDYAPGAMRALTPEDRMSVTEAAAYGREIGRCCVCGAELTDPKSVAAGIGPICGKRV